MYVCVYVGAHVCKSGCLDVWMSGCMDGMGQHWVPQESDGSC